MMKKLVYGLLCIVLLAACSQKTEVAPEALQYASGLAIKKYDSYTEVTVFDPWSKGEILQTYLLVAKDSELPDALPAGTVVRTPINNVLVYSDVHARAIKELGCVNSVGGVCDARFFKTQEIVSGLASGKVVDCGMSANPSVEKIVSSSPEAIMLSPFQNAGYGVLSNLGIPIIEFAEYMEQTPLGRAEWIKFLGLLYGKEEVADSIFASVEERYDSLVVLAKDMETRPKVLTETVTSGVWYVPGGKSYKAAMFRDAGADYPWSDDMSSGSLSLDFSQVLDKAQDADIWLITTYGQELTRKSLLEIYPHNDQFAAYGDQGIYYANSSECGIFEETPFHPDLLLKEYVKLFHPELLPDYQFRYYHPIKE